MARRSDRDPDGAGLIRQRRAALASQAASADGKARLGLRLAWAGARHCPRRQTVTLGGQNGVPGSAAFVDQAELFRRGDYIEVPLNPETARARFAHCTVLQP